MIHIHYNFRSFGSYNRHAASQAKKRKLESESEMQNGSIQEISIRDQTPKEIRYESSRFILNALKT